ncbi:hypothetical protein H0H87_006989 [Tephrocybe sp. NHM501043]|nr:hypothetical protein H0H87_006989 [Tephrocybe sp. NHM501043]
MKLPAPPTGEPPQSSIYDSLTTNIPHPVMAYSSYPFPPSTPLFPGASVVIKYLNDYADHFQLRPHIRLNTSIKSVIRNSSHWEVTASTGDIFTFDLVVVCNGHYRIPRYPDTPGISDWLSSGRASHSASYRRPHNLGDTILVVGGGPSGRDISAEMCTAARVVIHSATNATVEDVGNLKQRGRVSRFGENGQVTFEDGTVESGISHCILATGYEYSFPFLSESILRNSVPPPIPPLPKDLFNSTYSVFPLSQHVFPLSTTFPPSSLAFLGLLVRVAPFPLVEAQARAVLHAFSTPQSLDPMQEAVEVMTRYEELRTQVGDKPLAIAKTWHRFEPMQQFEYRDAMAEFYTISNGDLNIVWKDVQDGGDGSYPTGRVQEWEKEMYSKKDVLRKAWRRLEEIGQAEEWVMGVGKGGVQDWVDMTKKLEKWYEDEAIAEKPKL